MKRRYFGTDGIRGEYGGAVLTDAFAARLGKAVGRWKSLGRRGAKVVMGRDTRASGWPLTRCMAAGLSQAGCRVVDIGVLPTPAVAVYLREVGADLGVVVTASHNPAGYNGIKLFDTSGAKLSDAEEVEIEGLLDGIDGVAPSGAFEGETAVDSAAAYIELLQTVLRPGSLKDRRVVVDMANGAACQTTPRILRRLGAELIFLGDKPNGRNINRGVGSEYPGELRGIVVECGADLGIALDGDGDRLVLCDEHGKLVDGDVLLCMLALQEKRNDRLFRNTLVATHQSNIGLDRALKGEGVSVVRTPVGDRYVSQRMREDGFNLGGENSGHIIFSDSNPTGDGLLAALKVLSAMVERQLPLSVLTRCMELYPRRVGALPVREKFPLAEVSSIQDILGQLEHEMLDRGRVLLRYSGTEPIIRLLVEGNEESLVEQWYRRLEDRVRAALN